MPVQQQTDRDARVRRRHHGFTLIELLVVLALLSIMLSLSIPRFRTTLLDDPLNTATRQLIGLIREARQQAATSEQGCYLEIGIGAGTFVLICPRRARQDEEIARQDEEEPEEERTPALSFSLPDQVEIASIYNEDEQQFSTGEAVLWINNRGLMEPSIINIRSDDDVIGLVMSPFMSRIDLADRLLEPDTLDDL